MMAPPKKDLEIIYNLQWKNGTGNGQDKANIVGMYDTPATTLNWETFKSYLLKNSGMTGDDVKVSYTNNEDKEFIIESQLDFQIAIHSFRQRARNGEIITLKIDRLNTTKMNGFKLIRSLSDVIDATPEEPFEDDVPPAWFTKYMQNFRTELIESILNEFSMKCSAHSLPPRKLKKDTSKRARRTTCDKNEKELLRSIKLEKKLDCKLEKLEQKTLKIKEKKSALKDGDYLLSTFCNQKIGVPITYKELLMNASVSTGKQVVTIRNMSGGETYKQEWPVVNTGSIAWDSNTTLRYAWGTEALKPLEKVVKCPQLIPGQKGVVAVFLEVPEKPGCYECYWHFYQSGRRFGHWLGCQVIVDPCCVTRGMINLPKPKTIMNLETEAPRPELLGNLDAESVCSQDTAELMSDFNTYLGDVDGNLFDELAGTEQNIKIEERPSSVNSKSDNEVISIPDTSSVPSDEFVVVAMPQIEDECPTKEINTPELETRELRSNYAYITVNDQKVAVPKNLLRADFLETAEDAPEPLVSSTTEEEPLTTIEESACKNNQSIYLSTECMASSTIATSTTSDHTINANKNRVFVFPSNCPGYEVLNPPSQMSESMQSKVMNETIDGIMDRDVSSTRSCEATCDYSSEWKENYKWSRSNSAYSSHTSNLHTKPFNHSNCGGSHCQQHYYNANNHQAAPEGSPRYGSAMGNMFSENLVSGAVNVASSAINTARSVLNMLTPPSRPDQCHWSANVPETPREMALRTLCDMGFYNLELNATLLERFNDDIPSVISELLQ